MTSKISGNGVRRGYSIKGAIKERMFTVSEVASMMNAHPNSVRRWADMGLLSSYRIGVRGDRGFTPQALDQFLVSSGNGRHFKDLKLRNGRHRSLRPSAKHQG